MYTSACDATKQPCACVKDRVVQWSLLPLLISRRCSRAVVSAPIQPSEFVPPDFSNPLSGWYDQPHMLTSVSAPHAFYAGTAHDVAACALSGSDPSGRSSEDLSGSSSADGKPGQAKFDEAVWQVKMEKLREKNRRCEDAKMGVPRASSALDGVKRWTWTKEATGELFLSVCAVHTPRFVIGSAREIE